MLLVENFDITNIFDELISIGASSVKILTEEHRMLLLNEAEQYDFEPEQEIVGQDDRIVRQELSSFERFGYKSRFVLLKNYFQFMFDDFLQGLEIHTFETKLTFDSLVLQKYSKNSIGITPHRDELKYINLICIFIIKGKGSFFVCSDRKGHNAIEINSEPGNMIILRAPGFLGTKLRPFHYVTDINETRYTFGLRQKKYHSEISQFWHDAAQI